MFDKNSGLVQVWVRLITSGAKTLDDVPNISNLKEVIQSLLSL